MTFSKRFGTNNGAKLQTLINGICLCHDLTLVNVCIESDSALVVGWMEGNRCTTWYLLNYWEFLKKALQGINFTIKHILRKCNQAAYFLIENGESGKTNHYLNKDTAPIDVAQYHQNGPVGLSQLEAFVCLVCVFLVCFSRFHCSIVALLYVFLFCRCFNLVCLFDCVFFCLSICVFILVF